jgi:hypothetical protein
MDGQTDGHNVDRHTERHKTNRDRLRDTDSTSSDVATDDRFKLDGMSVACLMFCTDLLLCLKEIREVLNYSSQCQDSWRAF